MEVQCITFGEADGTAYFLQREQRRVMQADQAMLDILGKVMPYKVSPSYSSPSGNACTQQTLLPQSKCGYCRAPRHRKVRPAQ